MTMPPAFEALPDDPPPAPDEPAPEPATPSRTGPAVHPHTQIVEAGLGLLGPPASGKTTFLAALPIAAEQYAPGWMFYGANDVAHDFLQEYLRRLRSTRTLPAATMALQPEMRFVVKGVRRVGRRDGLFTRTRRVQSAVYLDVLDAPGGMYAWSGPSEAGGDLGSGATPTTPVDGQESDRDRLIRHVAGSSGLILLVDPVLADSPGNDAYDYIKGILMDITRRTALSSPDEFLPQHLAVCMTKCDHPAVYDRACEFGLVTEGADSRGFPEVSDQHAREFFDELCGNSRHTGPRGRASELRDAILHSFSPRRTRFFLTSSLGFGEHPVTGDFDPGDPTSVIYKTNADDGHEQPWLTGPIRPVNIFEPVLWLAGTQLRNGS
jgi:hypothetical protein